jgi:hypothetical protein
VEHQPAGLSDYAGLPHCGGVFAPAEPDRIRRLVGGLDQETQRRAANRFDPGRQDDPVIVVMVDGWEQFESRADPTLADVSLGPTLRDVIAVGAPLGVHIVPVGGQDLLTGKVPALCNQRLLLAFPNEDTRRNPLVRAQIRMSGAGSATMHETPAGVAQQAEQPSCKPFREPAFSGQYTRATRLVWRLFDMALI